MERPAGISMSKIRLSVIAIVLFHAVGLVGFMVPALQPLFIRLVPFHLLLMLLIVVLNHQRLNQNFWLFFAVVFLAGFSAEWVGVHTHLLFGNYTYGATLGTKVADIPLTIGVNWFTLVYATGVLLQCSRLKNGVARVITGAVALVLLDVLIEPVAIRFDYWHWAGGDIPLKNYICWFGLSVVLLTLFEVFGFKKQSVVAAVLLLVQFVFFGILQLA